MTGEQKNIIIYKVFKSILKNEYCTILDRGYETEYEINNYLKIIIPKSKYSSYTILVRIKSVRYTYEYEKIYLNWFNYYKRNYIGKAIKKIRLDKKKKLEGTILGEFYSFISDLNNIHDYRLDEFMDRYRIKMKYDYVYLYKNDSNSKYFVKISSNEHYHKINKAPWRMNEYDKLVVNFLNALRNKKEIEHNDNINKTIDNILTISEKRIFKIKKIKKIKNKKNKINPFIG